MFSGSVSNENAGFLPLATTNVLPQLSQVAFSSCGSGNLTSQRHSGQRIWAGSSATVDNAPWALPLKALWMSEECSGNR